MTSSRQHQDAHGTGQIEEQLNDQIQAATALQGESELDKEVMNAPDAEKLLEEEE